MTELLFVHREQALNSRAIYKTGDGLGALRVYMRMYLEIL